MEPKLLQESFVDTLSSQTEVGELDMIAISNFPDNYKSSYNKAIELSKNRGAQTAIKLLELIIRRTDLDKEVETVTEKEAIEITDFLNRQIKSLKNTESPFMYGLDYKKAQAMPSFISEVLAKYTVEYDKAIELFKKSEFANSIDKLNKITRMLKDGTGDNVKKALEYLEEQKNTIKSLGDVRYMLTLEGEVIENLEDLKKMRGRIEAEAEYLKQTKLSRPNFLSKIFKQRTVIPADVAIKPPETPSRWNLKRLKERFTSSTDKLRELGVTTKDLYNKRPLQSRLKNSLSIFAGTATLLGLSWLGHGLYKSGIDNRRLNDVTRAYVTEQQKASQPIWNTPPSARGADDQIRPDGKNTLTASDATKLQELYKEMTEAAPHFYTTKAGDGLEKIFKRESKALQDLSPAAKINAIYTLFRIKEGKDWLKSQDVLIQQPNGALDMGIFDNINQGVPINIDEFDDLIISTVINASGQTIKERAEGRYPNPK